MAAGISDTTEISSSRAQELLERVLPPKNYLEGWPIPSTQWDDVTYYLKRFEDVIWILQRDQLTRFSICLGAKTGMYYPIYADVIIAKYYLLRFNEKEALKIGNIIDFKTGHAISQRAFRKALNLKTKKGGKNKWARCTSLMAKVIAPLLGRLPLKRRNGQP